MASSSARKRVRYTFDVHFGSTEDKKRFVERLKNVRKLLSQAGNPCADYHSFMSSALFNANSLLSIFNLNHVLKCRTRVTRKTLCKFSTSIHGEMLACGPARVASLEFFGWDFELAAICAVLGSLPAGPFLFIRERTPVSPDEHLGVFTRGVHV